MFDLSNYSFSPYALPVLVVGISIALVGIAVLIWERGSRVSVANAMMTFSVVIWLLSFAAIYSTNDRAVAMDWVMVEHLGVIFIPSTVFFFTLAVIGRLRQMRLLAWASLAVSGLFYLGVVSTDWFVRGVDHHFWGYYPRYGPLAIPFLVFFVGMMQASFYLYRSAAGRTRSKTQQRRLKAILLAIGVASLASVDYLATFGIPVYPVGYLFIGVNAVMIARAIRRYRLTDITPAFAAKQIIGTIADALVVLDRDGVVRVANSAACELFEAIEHDLIGQDVASIAAWFGDALAPLMNQDTQRVEATYQTRAGNARTVLISSSMVFDRPGEAMATVCIVHDITERMLAEQAVRKSEALYRALVETSPDGVIVADQNGTLLMANRRAAELVGLESADDLRGKNAREFVAAHDQERIQDSFSGATGSVIIRDVEYTLIKRDGSILPAELSISWIPGATGEFTAFMAVVRDITDRKQAEETIRYLAFHDSLTGLSNRSVLLDRLTNALAQARRDGNMLAILFLDFDGFKNVNDQLGHEMGDKRLRDTATSLKALLREGDTLARMGGDEFVLLLPRIRAPDEAALTAQRVLRHLRRAERSEVPITASIGVAVYPADGTDAGSLLRSADLAMYEAKKRGGNSWHLAAGSDALVVGKQGMAAS
jgi:diguanylate cyclase (GGDEF)-like protein/PAS domain S-box-containing protein